jgi:hypothetical protein
VGGGGGGGGGGEVLLEEECPNFPDPRALDEQVVGVFIMNTGEAGGRGIELVSEAPFVGGEPTTPSQPADDLALQGSHASPDLSANRSTC